MDDKILKDICKMGQGADCCRYITVGPDGFECAKGTTLQATLDQRVGIMVAKGDNCDGKA